MNTKRKLLAIVLTLCMALSLVPVGALAEEEPTVVTTWAELKTAMSNDGAVKLGADIIYDESKGDIAPLVVPESKTVTLDLNGKVIDRKLTEAAMNGNVITVNGNLTVKDSNAAAKHENYSALPDGGVITGGYNDYNSPTSGGGVFVNGGAFVLESGTIAGNQTGGSGGGVYVKGNTGSYTMKGGTISGNNATSSGGGVYMAGGAFTMNDGAISGNTTNVDGGGVSVKTDCTFTMSKGIISGNMAADDGGGVEVYQGTFKMTGNECKIIENQAFKGGGVFGQLTKEFSMKNGTISQNQAGFGGGVSVYLCTFTMEGGKISGNHAAYAGNGVYVSGAEEKGLFIMKGGEISNNTPIVDDDQGTQNNPNAVFGTVLGGGVYVQNAGIELENGTISNNVSADGGGVYIGRHDGEYSSHYDFNKENDSFMSGGEITGNKAMGAGGGVNLDSGAFTMTGGLISSNEAYGEATEDDVGSGPQCGGGVYVGNGQFTMGGETTTPVIEKNKSDKGGGVYVPKNATFIVQGDLNISQNKAGEWQGSGLARTLANSSDDNVYLCKLGGESDNPVAPICVSDKLTNRTPIGVTTEIKPTQGNPIVFTYDLKGLDQVNSKGAAANFKSDDPAYEVDLDRTDIGIINDENSSYSSKGEAILSALWKVTFESNGGSEVEPQYVKNEGYATAPSPAPTRPGYTLEGWYKDQACTQKVTFSAEKITGDTTFYANWKQNSNPPSGPSTYKITVNPAQNGTVTASKSSARSGETITVTLAPAEGYQRDTVTVVDKKGAAVTTSGDGNTVTFKMPASDVTVTGTFKASATPPPSGGHWHDCPKDETCPIYPFTDANPKDWYHDGMHYCLDVGYVVGFGNFILGPNTPATRAQLVQILWNMEGNPTVNYQYTFEDVPADAWYADAVRWAASEGVVKGYSDKAFGPNDIMTREQFVTIVFRYADTNGADVSARSDLSGYDDAAKVSDWAKDAMEWAVANGIVVGRTETALSPQGSLTRAELTTIIQRYETKLTDKAA